MPEVSQYFQNSGGRPLAKRIVAILHPFVMSSGEKHLGNMKKLL